MDDSRRLRGIELRYALTNYLAQHGKCTIGELIDGLTWQGFDMGPDAPKAVSDALRWEIAHERVRRRSRGVYIPLNMPRATAHRIHRRVLELRARANTIRAAEAPGLSDTAEAGNDTRPDEVSEDDFWVQFPDVG